jgi:DNA replication licensing factor MCM2
VKDKARLYQVQRHEQPEKVTVKLSELEERVGDIHQIIETFVLTLIIAGEGT